MSHLSMMFRKPFQIFKQDVLLACLLHYNINDGFDLDLKGG